MTTVGATIVPIEVKAGTSRWLKSLRIFMDEKQIGLGIRISSLPLELDHKILSVPLYLTSELARLVQQGIRAAE